VFNFDYFASLDGEHLDIHTEEHLRGNIA
jgi:hypothetical protein